MYTYDEISDLLKNTDKGLYFDVRHGDERNLYEYMRYWCAAYRRKNRDPHEYMLMYVSRFCTSYGIYAPSNPPNKLSRICYSANYVMDFIYRVPIEEMPLYINDENIGYIARWRLKVGR